MNLLRFRPTTRDVRLELPDGSHRLVKVTTNDARTIQHIEDGDVLHGTGRPPPVVIQVKRPSPQKRGLLLRNMGMPRIRQAFGQDPENGGLWAPIHGNEVRR